MNLSTTSTTNKKGATVRERWNLDSPWPPKHQPDPPPPRTRKGATVRERWDVDSPLPPAGLRRESPATTNKERRDCKGALECQPLRPPKARINRSHLYLCP